MNNLFHDPSDQSTEDRIAQFWDLSGPVPLPKFQLQCPVCSGNNIQLRHCKFHKRDVGSENPYRCDVGFKCRGCSYAWGHGVVVPEEMATQFEMNYIVHWREIKDMLDDEDIAAAKAGEPIPTEMIIGSKGSTHYRFSCPVSGCDNGEPEAVDQYDNQSKAQADGWTFITDNKFCPPNEEIVAVCPACSNELMN